MTPENRLKSHPDIALKAFKEAGEVLLDDDSNELDIRMAVVGMLSAYAFMHGKPISIEDILNKEKKGEN